MDDGWRRDAWRLADRFDEVGDLLERQGAGAFRVRAWHAGANALRSIDTPPCTVWADEGTEGLERLPAIGRTLAQAIAHWCRTGTVPILERLRGTSGPAAWLSTVPGLGPVLARRVWEEVHPANLEALEQAAHDGRLAAVPGIGTRRLQTIRAAVAERVRRRPRRRSEGHEPRAEIPSVATLLEVDAAYRRGAQAGTLPTITPRRMNPEGRAWLPILHLTRAGRSFTAVFSNTPTAHRLGRTHDWVVVYVDDDEDVGPFTIVTQHGGPLDGRRVVRGRERECAALHDVA